jgi:exosortase
MLRSSSQRMLGTLFQFRMALRTCALVRFFCGAARCTRLRISSGPLCLQANTSPGAAPGSTTRFLLSAVKVIVGLSHTASCAVKLAGLLKTNFSQRSEFRVYAAPREKPPEGGTSNSEKSAFASRTNLVSCRPMQKLATQQKTTDASPVDRQHFSMEVALGVLFLAILWFGLCRELSGEWSVNEQYNFGWFVPFFALYLFWLRWQDRPRTEIRNPKPEIRTRPTIAALLAIPALLLLLPVRLFETANPEWRLLAWVHAASVVTLTLLLIWWTGGSRWVRHFAFPVAFIFVAVPWPTAVEVPIIQGLMRIVAHVAAETAMLLGTPAQVEGNLIRVSTGLVGVNEACSGIRSLQTSLMIGLLFGELRRLSILRRVALVAGAVTIALFANFFRAVFLVMVAATENLSEVSRWHDIAGYTIIAIVFVGTMGLAYLLGRKQRTVATGVSPARIQPMAGVPAKPKPREGWSPATMRLQPRKFSGLLLQFPAPYLTAALCWLLFIEIGTAAWYRLHERNLVSGIRWTLQWPQQAPNFRKLKIDPEIRGILRFDEGEAATWTLTSPATSENAPLAKAFGVREPRVPGTQVNGSRENTISCLLYLFRWKPGRNSALLANLHRPDVCLPASGWRQAADDGVRNYTVSGAFELPFRHFEFQRAFGNSAPQTAHAFYCLSEDRASGPSVPPRATNLPGMSGSRSEWTRAERFREVLEGRRHLGQQVIEAIFISSEPLSAADAEAYLHDLVRDVIILSESENRR